MKSIILKFIFTGLTITGIVIGQNVGINTTGAVADPSAILDVSSTNTGILVPRVVLTATNVAAPVTAPTNSLLVFNTNTAGVGTATGVIPGYYYWSAAASRWIRVLNDGDAWLTTGNYLGANGVFGTLTNYSIILGTNNVPRGAFMNTGELFLNPAMLYYAGDVFSSYATGGQYAVAGYSNTGASTAIYGENNAANVNSVSGYFLTTGTGWGVLASTTNNANIYPAIGGVTTNLAETGVAGAVNAASTITILIGGSGGAFVSPNTGVYANATNANSTGGLFAGNNVGAGSPAGGAGVAGSGSAIGVYGSATTVASGTGGVFAGNNSGYITLAAGSGVAGTGVTTGVFGTGTSATSTGGVFGGNNLATTTLAGGSGIAATGSAVGVLGVIPNNANNSMGGMFIRNGGAFIARVCENNGGTDQKIRGTGAVATVVKDLEGNEVTMFCPEAPEVLFQDFGQAQLINGEAVITLDPIFAKNVTINDKHPLRVIIQLEGDCNGVYVTDKSSQGFRVKELNGGTSNVSFTYFVTANRADRIENGELLSKFEDVRFLKGEPLNMGLIQNETIQGETIIHQTKEIKIDAGSNKREQKQMNQ